MTQRVIGPLVMIIAMCSGVINTSDIHDHITLCQLIGITRPMGTIQNTIQ